MISEMTYEERRDKILEGMRLAFERLVKEAARENRELIMSEDGKPVAVSARKLMKKYGIK